VVRGDQAMTGTGSIVIGPKDSVRLHTASSPA